MIRVGRRAVGALLAVLLVAAAPSAQVADSLGRLPPAAVVATAADSSRTPGGALRRALLAPGLGQVYVGQPIKTPIVIGALGGAVAYLVVMQRRTTLYRRAALYAGCLQLPDRDVCRETDLDALLPAYVETDGETVGIGTLQNRRDASRGSRDLAVVGVAAVYVLQALDAYVAAQLLGFDVSDDLSLRAEPAAGGARLTLRVGL